MVTNEARIQKMKDDGRDEYGGDYDSRLILWLAINDTAVSCRHSKAGRGASRELYDGP